MRRMAVITITASCLTACSQVDYSALHAQIQGTTGEIPYASVGVIRCIGDDTRSACMGCTVSAYEPGDLDNRIFAEVQEYNFRADGDGDELELVSFGGAHGLQRFQHDGTFATVRAAVEDGTQWCNDQGVNDWYVVMDTLEQAYEGAAR